MFLGFDPVFPFPFFKRESISFEDPWCDEGWGCCKVLNTCKLQQNGIDFKLHFFHSTTNSSRDNHQKIERKNNFKKDRQTDRQTERNSVVFFAFFPTVFAAWHSIRSSQLILILLLLKLSSFAPIDSFQLFSYLSSLSLLGGLALS